MRIVMLTEKVSERGVFRVGEEHDLPPALAKQWVQNGEARAVAQTRTQRREHRGSQRMVESR